MTDHPLTETAAIEDRLRDSWAALLDLAISPGMTYENGTRARKIASNLDETIRAAFDAGREHEREHADPYHDPRPWQDCTRDDICAGDLVETQIEDCLHFGVAHHKNEDGDWLTEDGFLLTWGDRWPLRRIPAPTPKDDITMTETTPVVSSEPSARTILGVPDTHGEPHHDADRIKAGDFAVQVDKDGSIRGGIAYHQGSSGDWLPENGRALTWASRRADRPDAVTVWPAPTPPAEEVTLPTEHPAHITDVEDADGDVCACMALNRFGGWIGVDQDGTPREWTPEDVTAFTLPDGTRARRDGDHEDGRPRFVKEEA